VASTRSTTRSEAASRPTTVAGSRAPPCRPTITFSSRATLWLAATITPSLANTVPLADSRRPPSTCAANGLAAATAAARECENDARDEGEDGAEEEGEEEKEGEEEEGEEEGEEEEEEEADDDAGVEGIVDGDEEDSESVCCRSFMRPG
jgi:hypothetical protein